MGTSNKATQAAQEADANRTAGIKNAVQQITQAYTSPTRTAQYDAYGKNLNDYYTGQVNDQEKVNARNLKFSLARNGLTGGSAAVDGNTQLQKDFSKGLLQASQIAQAGKSALQQSDINAKNQMIALAQAGNYTGAIPTQILQAQDASLGAAQNFQNAQSLGDIFKGTADIYRNQQTAAANRKAQLTPIGGLYNGSSPFGSATT